MKQIGTFFLLSLIILISGCSVSEKSSNSAIIQSSEVTLVELEEIIGFLASEQMLGRLPGTPEDHELTAYIAAQLKAAGNGWQGIFLPQTQHPGYTLWR